MSKRSLSTALEDRHVVKIHLPWGPGGKAGCRMSSGHWKDLAPLERAVRGWLLTQISVQSASGPSERKVPPAKVEASCCRVPVLREWPVLWDRRGGMDTWLVPLDGASGDRQGVKTTRSACVCPHLSP